MEKEIILGGKKIAYTFTRYRRSRHLRLSISSSQCVRISAPMRVSEKTAESFLREKAEWVVAHMANFEKKDSRLPVATREDYLKYKELAREIAEKKLKIFNAEYGFAWKRISIRNTRTRWGSCSQDDNLNFSYRIIYLPEKLCDYIIVHELCHLGQFNHSAKFWALVARTIPDFKERRREIRSL